MKTVERHTPSVNATDHALPAVLTVVPITLLLPYLDCELMLFLQLRLRETNTKEGSACRI